MELIKISKIKEKINEEIKKINNLINKEKNNNNLDGIFSEKDYLSPSYINLNNPKYIEI